MDLALFYELVEHIPLGIFILDAKGNYLYVNQEHCNIVSKERSFFENMTVFKLKEQGYLTTSVWEQVMEEKQKVVSVISVVDKDLNRVYDNLTTGMPIFGEEGAIEYIIYCQESVDQLYAYTQMGALNKHLFHNEEISVTPADDVIAESDMMKQLLALVDIVSKTDASILVSGPSGSGKEVVAKRIHQLSNYHHGPLVVLNCATLPENLMESELFGYEAGAFTGAVGKGKKGLIEMANGGTLFLDEINSMSPAMQAKLLRVLETKQVTRVGAVEAKDINFRLVCASNEDLRSLVEKERFRADLFYRINVISVDIPPLRQRKEDITPLVHHFMEYFSRKYSTIKALSPSVIELMNEYDWPGNVRELRNFVERIVVMSPKSEWEIVNVPAGSFGATARSGAAPHLSQPETQSSFLFDPNFSLQAYMDQCEKDVLCRALDHFHSPKKAAQALRLDLSNVYRKMQKYKISRKAE